MNIGFSGIGNSCLCVLDFISNILAFISNSKEE